MRARCFTGLLFPAPVSARVVIVKSDPLLAARLLGGIREGIRGRTQKEPRSHPAGSRSAGSSYFEYLAAGEPSVEKSKCKEGEFESDGQAIWTECFPEHSHSAK